MASVQHGGGESSETGTVARRRRDQSKRALGKKVGWLVGMVQSSASHHTGKKTTDDFEILARVKNLEQEVSTLATLVRNLVTFASEPHIVRVEAATSSTQPTVGKQKKVQFQEASSMEVDTPVESQNKDGKRKAAADEEVTNKGGARPAPAEQPASAPAAVQQSSASSSVLPLQREMVQSAQKDEGSEAIPDGFPRTVAEHFEPTPGQSMPQVPDALIRDCAQRLYDTDEKQHHFLLGEMVTVFVGVYAEESITRSLQRARDLAAQWHWGTWRWKPWCEPEQWPPSSKKNKRR